MKWNRKAAPWLLLLAMGLLTLILVSRKNRKEVTPKPGTTKEKTVRNEPRVTDPTSPDNNRDGNFTRHPSQVNYSKHALCRMDCRHIDKAEINDIVANGAINEHKSDMRAKPDPRYAIEGTTSDGQKVRIIVAQSLRVSTIVTVIDLGTDWNCHCPGDGKNK